MASFRWPEVKYQLYTYWTKFQCWEYCGGESQKIQATIPQRAETEVQKNDVTYLRQTENTDFKHEP